MKFNCDLCDYHTDVKNKMDRHNNSKAHKINSGELELVLKTCKYVKKDGSQCGKSCADDFRCKVHTDVALKRKSSHEYKEKHNKISKIYKDNNKDKIKQYYEDNKNEILTHQKQYYESNKEEISKKNKEYYYKQKDNFDVVCRDKVRGLKKVDILKKRLIDENEFITIEWIQSELTKQNNTCCYCNNVVLLSGFEQYDPLQFSIDRINNVIPHHKSNCKISCLGCNLKKH